MDFEDQFIEYLALYPDIDNINIENNIKDLDDLTFNDIIDRYFNEDTINQLKKLDENKIVKTISFINVDKKNREILKRIISIISSRKEETSRNIKLNETEERVNQNYKNFSECDRFSIIDKTRYFLNNKPINSVFYGDFLSVDYLQEQLKKNFYNLDKPTLIEILYFSFNFVFTKNYTGVKLERFILTDNNKNVLNYIIKLFQTPNDYWKSLIKDNTILFEKIYCKKNVYSVISDYELLQILIKSNRFTYDPVTDILKLKN